MIACCDQVYVCPTTGGLGCPLHGGSTICCDSPICAGAIARRKREASDQALRMLGIIINN